MFVDASAIVAILKQEPEASALLAALDAASGKIVCSQIARFEAVISLSVQAARGRGETRMTKDDFDQFDALVTDLLQELGARDALMSELVGRTAREAAAQYGKVVGHPAQLNMGDCFAYACAKAHRVGLLYKGTDFVHTDLA